MRHFARALALLVLLLAAEREARAYTDPGTGAMLWQLAVAALVGVAFYFRKITAWLKKKARKD